MSVLGRIFTSSTFGLGTNLRVPICCVFSRFLFLHFLQNPVPKGFVLNVVIKNVKHGHIEPVGSITDTVAVYSLCPFLRPKTKKKPNQLKQQLPI